MKGKTAAKITGGLCWLVEPRQPERSPGWIQRSHSLQHWGTRSTERYVPGCHVDDVQNSQGGYIGLGSVPTASLIRNQFIISNNACVGSRGESNAAKCRRQEQHQDAK